MAALIVVGWMMIKERSQQRSLGLDRRTILRLALLGVLLYTVTQGAVFVALDNQPAATTSLILSMTPLFVAGAAVITLAEIPSRRQIFGAVFVVLGAWLYFSGDLGATAAGLIAVFVALVANVASALLGRHANRDEKLSPVVVTAVSMAVGGMLLLAVGLAVEGIPSVSMRAWLIISWLAVVNTAFAFTMWNLSMRRLSAVESSGINNTMLIQIAILAWIFLDEAPGVSGLAGIVIVTVGIVLTQRTRKQMVPQRSQQSS